MASNKRIDKLDFRAWGGVPYVIDPFIPPDHFFCEITAQAPQGIFHIGAGTDIQLRLFYLNLTESDLRWLREMKVSLGNT
jgi:hypothetical protein